MTYEKRAEAIIDLFLKHNPRGSFDVRVKDEVVAAIAKIAKAGYDEGFYDCQMRYAGTD